MSYRVEATKSRDGPFITVVTVAVFVCNQCGIEGPSRGNGGRWFGLDLPTPEYALDEFLQHFCSERCLLAAVEKIAGGAS